MTALPRLIRRPGLARVGAFLAVAGLCSAVTGGDPASPANSALTDISTLLDARSPGVRDTAGLVPVKQAIGSSRRARALPRVRIKPESTFGHGPRPSNDAAVADAGALPDALAALAGDVPGYGLTPPSLAAQPGGGAFFPGLAVGGGGGIILPGHDATGPEFPGHGAPVPEPSTWLMMICGMALLGGSLRARRRPACPSSEAKDLP